MKGCVDVHYSETRTTAALVLFTDWQSPLSEEQYVHTGSIAAPYQAGEFYKRELPAILSVLKLAKRKLDTIIIDGYVWLDARHQRPGLGAWLFQELHKTIPVIGVAKTPYKNAGAIEVRRAKSKRPLFITAAGLHPALAAEHIASMHGTSRMPTMLSLADRLARQG